MSEFWNRKIAFLLHNAAFRKLSPCHPRPLRTEHWELCCTPHPGPVAHGGGPPLPSSDPSKHPPLWQIDCWKKDHKVLMRKCRLINQCNNQGIMTALSPECVEKCFCFIVSGGHVRVGPNYDSPINRDVAYREMMRERHKKEGVNKAVIKEGRGALR